MGEGGGGGEVVPKHRQNKITLEDQNTTKSHITVHSNLCPMDRLHTTKSHITVPTQ